MRKKITPCTCCAFEMHMMDVVSSAVERTSRHSPRESTPNTEANVDLNSSPVTCTAMHVNCLQQVKQQLSSAQSRWMPAPVGCVGPWAW